MTERSWPDDFRKHQYRVFAEKMTPQGKITIGVWAENLPDAMAEIERGMRRQMARSRPADSASKSDDPTKSLTKVG